MIYREFSKGKIKISKLGFGLMRLPIIDSEENIDLKKASEMLDFGISNGINYLDTAYPYHKGMSEIFIGEYLNKRKIREKIYLATKMPVWLIKNYDDFDFYFNIQLDRLKTNYIDFYLLHSLWKGSWDKIKDLNVIDWLNSKKREGKIRFFGFSFHDEFNIFKEIIDYYDWDFCQIQLNYMDINYQAGEMGLEYAKSKGIDVVIMEPLKGGKLANIPNSIKEIFDEYEIKRSPVEWAFLFLLSKDGILTILSGMSNLKQVEENINIFSEYKTLSTKEMEIINKARTKFLNIKSIDCTYCKYCLPCPSGVNIPKNFEIYNEAFRYNNFLEASYDYEFLDDKEKASNCIQCGECEEKCPQKLPIRELLKLVASSFSK